MEARGRWGRRWWGDGLAGTRVGDGWLEAGWALERHRARGRTRLQGQIKSQGRPRGGAEASRKALASGWNRPPRGGLADHLGALVPPSQCYMDQEALAGNILDGIVQFSQDRHGSRIYRSPACWPWG